MALTRRPRIRCWSIGCGRGRSGRVELPPSARGLPAGRYRIAGWEAGGDALVVLCRACPTLPGRACRTWTDAGAGCGAAAGGSGTAAAVGVTPPDQTDCKSLRLRFGGGDAPQLPAPAGSHTARLPRSIQLLNAPLGRCLGKKVCPASNLRELASWRKASDPRYEGQGFSVPAVAITLSGSCSKP